MWLLLLACTKPDLSGPVVATYSVEIQGERSGRAWLHAHPTAERTIWSEQLAWDLSLDEERRPGSATLALLQSGERSTHKGPLDTLPLPVRPLLAWAALPTEPQGEWQQAADAQGIALSDDQGLAMVLGPGLLILRDDLPEAPQLPGIRRAPIYSVPGQVGTLHFPPGVIEQHLAVAVDVDQVSEAAADWLAWSGVVVARSPGASPIPLKPLGIPCDPLVFPEGTPTLQAIEAHPKRRECDLPLQR